MYCFGPVAHLVEHLICTEGVGGSSPLRSTQRKNRLSVGFFIAKFSRKIIAIITPDGSS